MTNTDKIIADAIAEITSRPGYHLRKDYVADAVNAGLVDGDRLAMGQGCFCVVAGAEIVMEQRDKPERRMPIASMSDAQRAQLLTRKGVQAGRIS